MIFEICLWNSNALCVCVCVCVCVCMHMYMYVLVFCVLDVCVCVWLGCFLFCFLQLSDCLYGVVFDGLESLFAQSMFAAANIILKALNSRRFIFFCTLKLDFDTLKEREKQVLEEKGQDNYEFILLAAVVRTASLA